MFKKISFISLSLSLLLVFSCVSKNKYVELENRTNATQAQLEEDKKNLQAQNNKLLSENNRLLNTIKGLKLELKQEKLTVQQKEKEISELDRTRREIETSLKQQIAQKDIKLEEIEGKLKITFVDKILFDSGSVKVKPKGQEVLLKLADSFKDSEDQKIAVEGHTDDPERIEFVVHGRYGATCRARPACKAGHDFPVAQLPRKFFLEIGIGLL